MTGEVRQPLLERIHVANVGLRAAECRHDIVKGKRIDVLDKGGVEFAQIVESIELINHVGGIESGNHVQLIDMVDRLAA